jgi:transcriptional regulator with XRE-family HTH domain
MEAILHNVQIQVNRAFAYRAIGVPCTACKDTPMKVRLREFRNRLGLTIEKLAERSEYSVSQLSRWERNDSNIPSQNLPALAKTYGCRVSEIFADDDEDQEDSVRLPSVELPSSEEIYQILEVVVPLWLASRGNEAFLLMLAEQFRETLKDRMRRPDVSIDRTLGALDERLLQSSKQV